MNQLLNHYLFIELDVIDQLFPPLSNIQHPLEGISYLLILAVLFRWKWPMTWNKFLESISADSSPLNMEGKSHDEPSTDLRN